MTRIVIIEDEPDLALGLRDNLEFEGHTVAHAVNGEDGLRALEICLAAYRSAATHRPVAIADLRGGA